MVSAPEEAEGPQDHDAEWGSAGRRPRRLGRVLVVLTVLAFGGLGVAWTWPESDVPIVSAKENPPNPVDPNAAAAPCEPDDLDIGLAADRLTVTPGVPVGFTVSLRNEGSVQCLVEAPRHGLAVTVYQGEAGESSAERAWSSADCADQEEERLLLLGPGDVDTTNVSWSDSRSVPGCEPGQPKLTAGEYTAQVTLADIEGVSSDVVRMTYTVPEPSRSPSPSGSPSGDSSASPSAEPDASASASGGSAQPDESGEADRSGEADGSGEADASADPGAPDEPGSDSDKKP
ncbi:hypothetical protein ACFS27_28540 [Promicromonospora vindobonensis]|uniref:Uncharacterized protein n=1 Tax=Promicromonospora vindobonensis TaxID=195748 RepID=A0ABW5W153_9MICO